MEKKTQNLIIAIVALVLMFLLGIYVGKKTTPIKTVTKVEYVEAEPIHDSIDKPVPFYIKTPVDTANLIAQCVKDGIFYELFPEKTILDTIYMDKTDSTKLMADWASERLYEQILFDVDTLGRMKINTSVQYNRLGTIYYDFTPVVKTVTNNVYIERKFLPFVGVGLSTFPSYNAEVGLFINRSWGFSVNGNYYPNKENYEYIPKYDLGIKVLKMF